MEIRNYVAAVGRRWLWVAATALTAAVLAAGAAFLAPESYRSTTALYVGASSTAGPQGAAYAARVPEEVLPSLLSLARSPAVLGPVVDRLGLETTPHRLADAVEVAAQRDTAVLSLSATADSPREAAAVAEAVADELAARTDEWFGAAGTPVLTLTTVRPATEPRWSTGPDVRRYGLLGLLGGAALAVVACGLLERGRPRVRTGPDVARLTGAPVLAVLPATHAGRRPDARSAEVDRLRWALGRGAGNSAVGPGARLLVVGSATLADELGPAPLGGRQVVAVAEVEDLPHVQPGDDDVSLLVVDGRRATARRVREQLGELVGLRADLVGVVVDGVLPRHPRLRARIAAAVRGRAPVPAFLGVSGASTGALTGTGVIALAGLFLVGLHRALPLGMSTGFVAAVALLPLWIGILRRVPALAWLAGLAGAGLVTGALLARWSSADHDFARYEAIATALLVVTAIGGAGLLLWARTVLPLHVAVLAVGAGHLVDGILRSPASTNAFKYELTVPVTVVVLALLGGRRRPVLTIGVLGVLGLANLAFDARSAAGFCVLAAVLVGWQARPTALVRRAWWGRTTLALGLGAAGAYATFSELLLSGLAGAELQQRTAAQIEQSGSLLLGGRPEWTATWALMREQPLGFGLGTVPSPADVAVAKEGMSITHIPTAEGYIENYMFAGRFELHSIVADLWSNLGVPGLLLGILTAGVLVQRLSVLLQDRRASALACFLGLNALWALAFGPLPTDILVVTLALGVLLPAPAPARSDRPVVEPAPLRAPAGAAAPR